MALTEYIVRYGFYLNGTRHRRLTSVELESTDAATQSLLADYKIFPAEGWVPDESIVNADIADGSVTNAKVAVAAGIVDSKLDHARVTFSNEAAICAATTRVLAQIGTMSASRAVTLPAANAVAAGTEIIVADESGTVTGTNTIVVTRAGSDTIDGATTTTIMAPHGWRRLISNGVDRWTFDGGILRASTATAKGDLLAATAAGAVTNLAVGADGAHLRAASSASAGVAWVRQSPPINVGDFFTPGIYTGTTNFTSTQGQCWYWPIFIPQAMTVSEVRLIMGGSAAASGALWRLGFFNADTPGTGPGTVLADLSTVDPTTSGTKAWTGLSVAISAGILWCGMALQGTGSGGGNYYYTSNPGVSGVVKSGSIGTNVYNHILTQSSVSGAFATAAPTASGSSGGPLLEFKRSA